MHKRAYLVFGSVGTILSQAVAYPTFADVSAAANEKQSDATTKGASGTTNEASSHVGKNGYHKRFNNADRWVKKFDDPARDKWQMPDEVIQALKINDKDNIADIGAGTGYFSLRIAQSHPHTQVYAADIEPDMVAYMKEQTEKLSLSNHFPMVVGTKEVTFPQKLNLILVVDTYHHIDDRIPYFAALKQQLLPEGRIAIIDFTAESPEGPPPEHRISKAEMEEEMKRAGYELNEDVKLLPYQYFLIFKPR